MSGSITKTPQARRDLVELGEFIARDSLQAANRFLDAAEAAFGVLASMPELGILCHFASPQASGVRVWSIKGFENYVIFYRCAQDGIEVVRVLHGARDVSRIFANEGG